MKVAITMFSALAVGLLVAANNYTPLMELRSIVQNRRRAVLSVLLGAAGFIFIMASILLGSIDLALQYEVQGFILWNTVLAVATGFFIAALLCFGGAKILFPKPYQATGFMAATDFGGIAQSLEMFKPFFEAPPPPSEPRPPEAAKPSEAVQAREDIKQRPHGDFTIEQQPGFVH